MLLSNARLVILGFFLAGGVGVGTWAASLPALVRELQLEERPLGLILLCFALGAIATMTAMGRVIVAKGGRAVAYLSTAGFGGLLIIIPHTADVWSLAVVVAAAGAAFGSLDVSMNTSASELERVRDQRLMSSFHAAFSIGNLVGAVVCGQVLKAGGDVRACFAISGIAIIVMAVLTRAAPGYVREVPSRAAKTSSKSKSRSAGIRGKGVLVLGAMAFLSFLSEGAILDWSGILLVERGDFDAAVAAFAFAVFAGTMAVGRLLGDIAIDRMGPVFVIRVGMIIVAASFAVVLLGAPKPVIFLCLGVSGFGVANVVPCIFSAAGRAGGDAAGAMMSKITTIAYSGLLVGPAVIGFLAHSTNLPTSLGLVVAAAIMVAASSSIVREDASIVARAA